MRPPLWIKKEDSKNVSYNNKKAKMFLIYNDNFKIEIKRFNDDQETKQSKTSAQMILEPCHNVGDKTLFPMSIFPCIVAPLKVLEALIADLHSLKILLGYNKVPTTQPLYSPPRDGPIELML